MPNTINQVLVTDKSGPGHQHVPYCPEEQQELGGNKRQADLHRIHRTAACTDICATPEACCLQRSNTNPAGNDAGHQTGSNQWPRGQHEPGHRYLASSASGTASGCPGMTNVLIGNSVARPIKPDLVFPGGQSQNLSVSGLAIDDVNHWLANIPRNREVRRVVIHIGVNTCKFAVVTESMWRQLIRKLKHVFPEAAVLVSSIVPPMGRLRKTVQVSNAALLAVYNREKVSFINHTDAFTARSGAPQKHLYRDQLHPSDGGMSRLVFNLQLATGTRHRQAQHHLPSSRPQHRQDPAQPQQRQEGIKQHHAARPSLLGPVPPGFVPHAQHHWLAYLNSRQWQRTTAPQQHEADLFRPAYGVRHNTAVNSPRPPTPPVYHHCVPRDLYPPETLV